MSGYFDPTARATKGHVTQGMWFEPIGRATRGHITWYTLHGWDPAASVTAEVAAATALTAEVAAATALTAIV